MGWIRIRMDSKLLPGSGSGTRKIQSWIRILNKSFRIRKTAFSFQIPVPFPPKKICYFIFIFYVSKFIFKFHPIYGKIFKQYRYFFCPLFFSTLLQQVFLLFFVVDIVFSAFSLCKKLGGFYRRFNRALTLIQ